MLFELRNRCHKFYPTQRELQEKRSSRVLHSGKNEFAFMEKRLSMTIFLSENSQLKDEEKKRFVRKSKMIRQFGDATCSTLLTRSGIGKKGLISRALIARRWCIHSRARERRACRKRKMTREKRDVAALTLFRSDDSFLFLFPFTHPQTRHDKYPWYFFLLPLFPPLFFFIALNLMVLSTRAFLRFFLLRFFECWFIWVARWMG